MYEEERALTCCMQKNAQNKMCNSFIITDAEVQKS